MCKQKCTQDKDKRKRKHRPGSQVLYAELSLELSAQPLGAVALLLGHPGPLGVDGAQAKVLGGLCVCVSVCESV